MKVLVLGHYGLWAPHVGTALELAEKHLALGDEVVFSYCDGELPTCEVRDRPGRQSCDPCASITRRGIALLRPKNRVKLLPMRISAEERESWLSGLKEDFRDIGELDGYKIGALDLGNAAQSSVMSRLRTYRLSLSDHGPLLKLNLQAGLLSYHYYKKLVKEGGFDLAYLFNGRFAPTRGALRAFEEAGLRYFTHERGHNIAHYMLYENSMPHNRAYVASLIKKGWLEAEGNPDRNAIAEKYFVDRSNAVAQAWYSFVGEQEKGLLPEGWNPGHHNVAIFNSSEDEFAAIGADWKSPYFPSQYEGLKYLVEQGGLTVAEDGAPISVYLRVHPNLGKANPGDVEQLKTLAGGNFHIIPPESKISSYDLLKNASVALSFGSTMGIEANFWGVPSVLAGMCYYRDLGGTYNPVSTEELPELLKKRLSPLPKEAALMYGYYLATFGEPFRYYKGFSLSKGSFKGLPLKPSFHLRLAEKVRRLGRKFGP